MKKQFSELPSSDSLHPYFAIRPQSSDEFKAKLRSQILSAEIEEPKKQTETWWKKPLFFRFALTGFVLIVVITVGILFSEPVWSKVRERIMRLFTVTQMNSNDTPSSFSFWSDMSQQEFIPNTTGFPETSNALIPSEAEVQPPPPTGFSSVAEYIIATYHLNEYHSIEEILAHTPAEIIREEPFYSGKLYVLRFPGGFMVSYTKFTGSSGDKPAIIQSIR